MSPGLGTCPSDICSQAVRAALQTPISKTWDQLCQHVQKTNIVNDFHRDFTVERYCYYAKPGGLSRDLLALLSNEMSGFALVRKSTRLVLLLQGVGACPQGILYSNYHQLATFHDSRNVRTEALSQLACKNVDAPQSTIESQVDKAGEGSDRL